MNKRVIINMTGSLTHLLHPFPLNKAQLVISSRSLEVDFFNAAVFYGLQQSFFI